MGDSKLFIVVAGLMIGSQANAAVPQFEEIDVPAKIQTGLKSSYSLTRTKLQEGGWNGLQRFQFKKGSARPEQVLEEIVGKSSASDMNGLRAFCNSVDSTLTTARCAQVIQLRNEAPQFDGVFEELQKDLINAPLAENRLAAQQLADGREYIQRLVGKDVVEYSVSRDSQGIDLMASVWVNVKAGVAFVATYDFGDE